MPLVTVGPAVLEIGGHGLPDIRRQWKPIRPRPLAMHQQLSSAPVDVIKGHGCNLAGPQAQPRQERENGSIPSTRCRVDVAAAQQTIDGVGRQRPRQLSPAPRAVCREGSRQRGGDQSLDVEEAQERA